MKLIRKIKGHKTMWKMQGPDEYMRARCTCGSDFKTRDDRWGLPDFQIWEKKHKRLGE